ncbi:MAG TPA: class I SAM-dependent methyltransferase [Vicinamibacterales bacterium]
MVHSDAPFMRDPKRFFYDTIADDFDTIANAYDTQRRVEIVFDEMLRAENLAGRTLLDVGCGTGWFSAAAARRAARVTSLDVGMRLLELTRARCASRPVAGDACALPFPDGAFDLVVSSECIEHTVAPLAAVREIRRVVRPGGLFLITVPNRVWRFAATVANGLGLRPYDGYENWVGWGEMRRTLADLDSSIVQMRGFHAVPPVIRATQPLLRRLDALGESMGPVMLNMAVLARR